MRRWLDARFINCGKKKEVRRLLIDYITCYVQKINHGTNSISKLVFLAPLCARKTSILNSVCRSSPMDWKKTATGPDHNQKGPICKQLVLTGLWLHNNISKNPCENTLKTTIIWIFTCFLFFYIDKLLHLITFCAVYILYNIIPKIHIQNPSVLWIISHKNCRFQLFSPVFNRFRSFSTVPGPNQSKPVLAGCGCWLPIFRPKNRTGPDLRTLILKNKKESQQTKKWNYIWIQQLITNSIMTFLKNWRKNQSSKWKVSS